jgi:hypothetical protein
MRRNEGLLGAYGFAVNVVPAALLDVRAGREVKRSLCSLLRILIGK